MCMLTPSRHTIRVDVKVIAQNAHIFREMCGEICGRHSFETDVPEYTRCTHL